MTCRQPLLLLSVALAALHTCSADQALDLRQILETAPSSSKLLDANACKGMKAPDSSTADPCKDQQPSDLMKCLKGGKIDCADAACNSWARCLMQHGCAAANTAEDPAACSKTVVAAYKRVFSENCNPGCGPSVAIIIVIVVCVVIVLPCLVGCVCEPGCPCYDGIFKPGASKPLPAINGSLASIADEVTKAAAAYAADNFAKEKVATVVVARTKEGACEIIAASGETGWQKGVAKLKTDAVIEHGSPRASIYGPPSIAPCCGLCRVLCCLIPSTVPCGRKLFLRGAVVGKTDNMEFVVATAGSNSAYTDEEISANALKNCQFQGDVDNGFTRGSSGVNA